MSIVKGEIEPEKKITISKVNFSCDIIDPKIPKPLFQNYNHFPKILQLFGPEIANPISR